AFGKVPRHETAAWFSVERIADRAHGQVDFVRDRRRGGCNGIEPWLQRSQTGDEIRGSYPGDWEAAHDVDDMIGLQEGHALTENVFPTKVLKLAGAAELGPMIEKTRRHRRDFQRFGESAFQRELAIAKGKRLGTGKTELVDQPCHDRRI